MKTLKISFLIAMMLGMAAWLQAQTSVGPFTFYPTNQGGTMQGQAQINGVPAVEGDIVAAFDPTDDCVGAAELSIYGGLAYINFVIYGDDGDGHGMSPGEDFHIKLYDASSATIINYGTGFSGWQNNNFAPMPGFNDPGVVYNFISASLSVLPGSRAVSSAAGSTTFAITSNTTWAVTDNASWLAVSPTSGSNNATITATYLANTGSINRIATIAITGVGISSPVLVTVNQAAPKYLYVSPDERNVASGSGNTTFTLTSNTSWSVSDNVSRLAVNPASGSNNANLTATFTGNTSNNIRSARIIAVGSGAPNDTVWVHQYPVIRTLTVGSQNPNSGVPISVSPADTSGTASGTTQFVRKYFNNQTS